MTESASLMQTLKEETWDLHKKAETQPLEQNLVRGTLPQDVYVTYLEQRLIVMRAMEKHMAALAAKDTRVAEMGYEPFMLAEHLEKDLKFFGSDPSALEPLSATSQFLRQLESTTEKKPLALLGVLYVFAGSTNGAKFISRAILRAYELQPGQATNFLDPFGDEQRHIWGGFKTKMDETNWTAEEKKEIVSGALLGFASIMEVDRQTYTAPLAEAE